MLNGSGWPLFATITHSNVDAALTLVLGIVFGYLVLRLSIEAADMLQTCRVTYHETALVVIDRREVFLRVHHTEHVFEAPGLLLLTVSVTPAVGRVVLLFDEFA